MSVWERYRGVILAVVALVIISPLFGIILAEKVGYHEPLDVAAEKLGLAEKEIAEWTPFSDYTFPGLPDTLGYIAAGFLGVGVIIALGWLLSRRIGG